MKTILFTGGGSAGHVTGNLVLIPKCLQEGWRVHYIGSETGIEKQLVETQKAVQFHSISTGKLRRYFSWKNVSDVFQVLRGILQAYFLLRKIKPDVVYSLGGFVSVPVVLGARMNKIRTIIHEPDVHMGLANRLCLPFADTVCTTFAETRRKLDSEKAIHVGPLIKESLKAGQRLRGIAACGFHEKQPVLLIMGGSQGAETINRIVRGSLANLLSQFQVIHICGQGKVDYSVHYPGYKQYDFVGEELADLLAAADVVVSRAGSNAISELLALQKPMLLLPHTNGGARTGQLVNAHNFQAAGYADVLLQEQMTTQMFVARIFALYKNRETYLAKMRKSKDGRAVDKVWALLKGAAYEHFDRG
ncbi:undecaprenyldiphospho-muramoylpentapeptide beta-N-acetylglucosaminyltransferase [Brevibacillus porteri]|uniref:undecaprenyldiphospho-muramoylpentapeptide beta-N-acetylglucosaminyltransferase n=1 Tax=Brevibacillus porteri TaxID=2126350 RepID=UPI00370A067F